MRDAAFASRVRSFAREHLAQSKLPEGTAAGDLNLLLEEFNNQQLGKALSDSIEQQRNFPDNETGGSPGTKLG